MNVLNSFFFVFFFLVLLQWPNQPFPRGKDIAFTMYASFFFNFRLFPSPSVTK